MALSPHTIHPAYGSRKKTKRVGRGSASQKGTTAGRGTKGQRARSGGRRRTKLLGLRQSLLKIPKLRGFKSMHPKPATVTLAALQRITGDGDTITSAYLLQKRAIRSVLSGVKIVGNDSLTKKLTVSGCRVSRGARAAIEKAGGTVTI